MDEGGPELLRSMRARSSLTQDALADAAGLHVRTVRGLESGRIVSPRRTSVDLLAHALGLDAGEHLRLRLSWGITDSALPSRPITHTHRAKPAAPGRVEVIEKHLARSNASLQKLTIHEQVFIDATRQIATRVTQEVVLALVDNVSTYCVYYDAMDEQVDMAQLRLTGLENCSVAGESLDPARVGKFFVMDLGCVLRRGESHVVRYVADFAAARTAQRAGPISSGENMVGFLKSPASCVLEVQFDQDHLPSACWRVYESRPTVPSRAVCPMEISTSHSVHLALLDPTPGGHGIAWRW